MKLIDKFKEIIEKVESKEIDKLIISDYSYSIVFDFNNDQIIMSDNIRMHSLTSDDFFINEKFKSIQLAPKE